MAGGFDSIKPAGMAWPVTPSDSTVFKVKARAFCVGAAGNLVLWQFNPETGKEEAITHAVQAGVFPAESTMVMAATSATGITAMA